MKLVHIVPGWSEGKWHFKQFDSHLKGHFKLTENSQKADIIIAHSSGCYSLPATNTAKLVVLVNPPFWPGKPLINRSFKNVFWQIPKQIKSFGFIFLLKMRLRNILNILSQPWKHIKVWRSLRQTFLKASIANKTILIRNKDDAFCNQEIEKYLQDFPDIKYIELPGLHEDIWRYPKVYIDLLLKEL